MADCRDILMADYAMWEGLLPSKSRDSEMILRFFGCIRSLMSRHISSMLYTFFEEIIQYLLSFREDECPGPLLRVGVSQFVIVAKFN